MIIDLFFYLTYWFNKNREKLKWSTPVERSSYVIGLSTTTFLFSIAEVLGFTIYKNSTLPSPKLLFVGVGLLIMYLYDFIYVKKDRYGLITSNNMFDSKKPINGVIISWIIVGVCIFMPFIIFAIFVPFGDQRAVSNH